ncbi:MAG: ABC transporter permease [Vicinamibacteria bacterium]|nr:ABC transporter permease [Vicinamibacteria bacterium]
MNGFINDLRVTWRRLLKTPGFTAGAVLTLALGIGASIAVFAVVSGVLLRPLPFANADRLVFITREGDVGIPDGVDWRKDSRTLEEIALFLRSWDVDLLGAGEPQRLHASVAEPDLFRVFGATPLHGRFYGPEDNRPGAPAVAVLSEGLWKRQFGSDPSVIGRTVSLTDTPTTVVGIAREDLDFLHDGVDLWVPPAFVSWALNTRGSNNFDAVGRLREGVTIEESVAEMVGISKRLEAAYPDTNRGKIVEPLPMLEFMVGSARRALLVLLVGVAIVVLASSVNLATALLARSAGRREEYAVRLALGGGQRAIARHAILEGLMLSLLGGACGALLAVLARRGLLALVGDVVPRAWAISLDTQVLGFAVLVSLLAGVLMAALPAWQVVRGDLAPYLRSAGRGGSPAATRRFMDGVVGFEVALAVLLLMGAGLLLRTFDRLQSVPLGFNPDRIQMAQITLPESRYLDKIPEQVAVFRQVLDHVSTANGIESAAYVLTPPLDPRGGAGGSIVFRTKPEAEPVRDPGARARMVMGDYFATIGTQVVEGRSFTAADREGTDPVAIINERFAREFWPNSSPIGAQVAWRGWAKGAPVWMTIVGVAKDLKGATLQGRDYRTLYAPYAQHIAGWQRWGSIVARTRMTQAAFADVVKAGLRLADPTVPLGRIETLESRRDAMLGPQRLNAVAIGLFALIAFVVAFQGIYAILARAVSDQRRELGIRLALGASPGSLLNLVMRRGVRLTVTGLLFGVLGSILLGRALQSLLFEVQATDPLTFGAVGALVGLAALASSYLPGREAARTEPAVVLRQE